MSSIEQAAKRLEELRRAGVEISEVEPAVAEARPNASPPTPEAVVRALEAHAPASVAVESAIRHHRGQLKQPPARSSALRADSRYTDIDMQGLAARGFISPNAPQSQLADEFRVIKRPIIRNALGKDAIKSKNRNLVMVTSALPGEGKTFTAVNLALSVAMEYDNTVLLVDGEVVLRARLRLLVRAHRNVYTVELMARSPRV